VLGSPTMVGALFMAVRFLWPPLGCHTREESNEPDAAATTLRILHQLQTEYAGSHPTRGSSCFFNQLSLREV
jgi:hypothetical protein